MNRKSNDKDVKEKIASTTKSNSGFSLFQPEPGEVRVMVASQTKNVCAVNCKNKKVRVKPFSPDFNMSAHCILHLPHVAIGINTPP